MIYEVRRDDGTVVARSSPKPLARNETGAYADIFKLTLQRPGAYEMRLTARDRRSGDEALFVEPFLVAAGRPAGD
jgi:hypothetical protein